MCAFKPGLKLFNQVLCFKSISMVLMYTEYGQLQNSQTLCPLVFFYTMKICFGPTWVLYLLFQVFVKNNNVAKIIRKYDFLEEIAVLLLPRAPAGPS